MKSPAKHRELEVKIDGECVEPADFNAWCFDLKPSQYLRIFGHDDYYVQGKNVVRHRKSGGAGELTVKRRKSKKSTRDRLEIDLKFDHATTTEDVMAFLLATGWERQFTIIKDAHLFFFNGTRTTPGVEAVIYDVRLLEGHGKYGAPRRFIEFEIHKADSSHPLATPTLRDWENAAREKFMLGETMTESLYELYSGKQYQSVK